MLTELIDHGNGKYWYKISRDVECSLSNTLHKGIGNIGETAVNQYQSWAYLQEK